jgi:hypothetical protein
VLMIASLGEIQTNRPPGYPFRIINLFYLIQMIRQCINPLDFEPAERHSFMNLHLHKIVFCFAFIVDCEQARLSGMIQQMAGIIGVDAEFGYIFSCVPMEVDSKAICVKPAWIDGLYSSKTSISYAAFLHQLPIIAPQNASSKPIIASVDEITRALKIGLTFEQIITKRVNCVFPNEYPDACARQCTGGEQLRGVGNPGAGQRSTRLRIYLEFCSGIINDVNSDSVA